MARIKVVFWAVLFSQFPLCCLLGMLIARKLRARAIINRRVGHIAAGMFPA